MLLALLAAHETAHFAQQLTLEDVRDKGRSLLCRLLADVVLHFAVDRLRWQRVGNVLELGVEAIKHVAQEFVCIVLVVAFKLRHHFPDPEEETFGRDA